MRWLLLFLACAAQGTGLMLLWRSGWFAGSAKAAAFQKHPVPAVKATRNALVVFGMGGALMLLFALWERHFILALGQLAASALCLLGGRTFAAGRDSGNTSHKTGLP